MNKFELEDYKFRNKYRLKSLRLSYYNYSSDGYYFFTICTKGMFEYFGEIKNGIMALNEIGCMVWKYWKEIPKHFNNVILDEFIVMPNHVHGIIEIWNNNNIPTNVETHCNASLPNDQNDQKTTNNKKTFNKFGPQYNNLGTIIRGIKNSVKRNCNKLNIQFQWQSNYYEKIIRDEKGLNAVREYIKFNPAKWDRDRNNLNRIK